MTSSSIELRRGTAIGLVFVWFAAGCGRSTPEAPVPLADITLPAPTPAPETQADVAAPSDTTETSDAVETRAPSKLEAAKLRIGAIPEELMVYRSTPVLLSIGAEDADGDTPRPEGTSCRWRMGDGTPELDGCEVEHVFVGGSADARISVTVKLGADEVTLNRILPLERLPVSGPRTEPDGDIPAAPDGPTSFRVVFVADTAGLEAEAQTDLVARIGSYGPHLVIHQGGVAGADAEEWQAHREGFAEPLRARGIPLIVVPSPLDLKGDAEIRRPLDAAGDALELAHGDAFPARYAFSFRGIYFAVISGDDQDGAGDSGLKWLRARLGEAQIYESRIVLSHLPLHAFSAEPGGLIGPKFKLYELLHRGRATALISAGHKVFFKGRYGALPVLSVGSATSGGRLLGHDHEQPATIAVMDVVNGVPTRIFALVGRGGEPFSALFDESYLPETVEVYTR